MAKYIKQAAKGTKKGESKVKIQNGFFKEFKKSVFEEVSGKLGII